MEQELERRLNELKIMVIAKLQNVGLDALKVASNRWTDLVLHTDSNWSIKLGMSGFPLVGISFSDLLEEYARIVDGGYQKLEDKRSKNAPDENSSWDDFPEKYEEETGRLLKKYVQENKQKLLESFIQAMEATLQKLSKS